MEMTEGSERYLQEIIRSTKERVAGKLLFDESCIVSIGARLLGDKWTLIILVALLDQRKRYSELQRQIPDISPKMLTQTLKQLENIEMVKRTVHAEVPPRVEYELTSFGKSVEPVIALLCDWSARHESKLRKL